MSEAPTLTPELENRDIADRIEMFSVMRLVGYPDRLRSMLIVIFAR